MSDYISREAAVKIAQRYGLANGSALGRHSGLADCIAIEIEGLPTTNVEPVRHGRWKRYSTTMMICSLCGKHTARHKFNYCPNCGAKMQGEENDG